MSYYPSIRSVRNRSRLWWAVLKRRLQHSLKKTSGYTGYFNNQPEEITDHDISLSVIHRILSVAKIWTWLSKFRSTPVILGPACLDVLGCKRFSTYRAHRQLHPQQKPTELARQLQLPAFSHQKILDRKWPAPLHLIHSKVASVPVTKLLCAKTENPASHEHRTPPEPLGAFEMVRIMVDITNPQPKWGEYKLYSSPFISRYIYTQIKTSRISFWYRC